MPSSRTRSVLHNIAANVRARRVRLSLTQERVAEGAKLDLRHYQRVERGQVNVTIDRTSHAGRALRLLASNGVPHFASCLRWSPHGAAFVLGRRAIIDVPTALVGIVWLVVLTKVKKVPAPVLILAAAVVRFAHRAR